MVIFHILSDICRPNQWCYIKRQEGGIHSVICSVIHQLSRSLWSPAQCQAPFYTLEGLWQIRQKMCLLSRTFVIRVGHRVQHPRVINTVQGMKTWCDDVGVATVVWGFRDTCWLKSELSEAANHAKSRQKKVMVEEGASATSLAWESVGWVLGTGRRSG